MEYSYSLPIFVQVLIFPVGTLLFIELGIRLGRWRRSLEPNPDSIVTRDVAVGGMMALLGLVLAFTYSFSLSRADLRKQATLAEVNAISSAWLVSQTISAPERRVVQESLLRYAESRVFSNAMFSSPASFRQAVETTESARRAIWPAFEQALARPDSTSPERSLVVNTVNNIYNSGRGRITFGVDRMPANVRVLVMFVACVSLGAAAFNTSLGGNVFRVRLMVFALVLSALVATILDFENPLWGLIQTDQMLLKSLIAEMHGTLGSAHR